MVDSNGDGDLPDRLQDLGVQPWLNVTKVGFTAEQFREWFQGNGVNRLPLNPTPIKLPTSESKGDSRAPKFAATYGDHGAELDAIPLDRLRALLKEELSIVVDYEKFNLAMEREAAERERLRAALEELDLDDAE